MSDTTRARFDLGRVLERLFGALGRNFLVFFGLALILTGLPAALSAFAFAGRVDAASDGGRSLALFLAGSLIGFVSSFILQASIVHGAVMDLNGRRPTLVDCLTGGLRHFLPVLAISILAAIAVMFGLLIFLAPGIILLTVWAVVVPAQVVENRGVFGAFGRSADLTDGHRWAIFALLVVWLIISFVIGAAITGGALSLAASTGSSSAQALVAWQGLAQPLANALSAVISSTGIAALYVELRRAREGAAPEDLAAVFD
ncbi:MAG TPA: hypothetical protein VEA79_10775 [Phenylobacterium sp.]|nr:hypothetical protein [Phenylobacterium sp.]